MRLRWRKYTKTIPRCIIIMFLSYLIFKNTSRKLFEYGNKIGNGTLRNPNAKRMELLNEMVENYKLEQRKMNKTVLYAESTCGPVYFPFLFTKKDSWSRVDINRTAFVFSAYVVDKQKIVVIGIKSSNVKQHYCQIWYENITQRKIEMKEQLAEIITVPEGHGLRYTPVLFQCMLPTTNKYPSYVSIVQEKCQKTKYLLRILNVNHDYDKHKNRHRKFTVCLTPLNFKYDRANEIIEWVELNRILGAERFIVYNYSSGSHVQPVLRYYMKQGLMEVIQWNLPVKVNTLSNNNNIPEIHYFGQVAALHDCLYRNKGVSEYIVNLDLDEFIIPHGRNLYSWSDIIKDIHQEYNVYLFRNTFFKKEWDNSGLVIQNVSLVNKLQLVTLKKLQHERKLFGLKIRSKYIVKTANVSRLMIHEVPGIKYIDVPIRIAFIHHYRDWGSKNDPEENKVLDETVPNKFGNILLQNVLQVRNNLEKLS